MTDDSRSAHAHNTTQARPRSFGYAGGGEDGTDTASISHKVAKTTGGEDGADTASISQAAKTTDLRRKGAVNRSAFTFIAEEEVCIGESSVRRRSFIDGASLKGQLQPLDPRWKAWSQLFPEILSLIAVKLVLDDKILFSQVCKQWQMVSKSTKAKPSPWLMCRGNICTTRRLFSVASNNKSRFYIIQLPKPAIVTRQFIGSSHGWLITVDMDCNIHLLCPLSGIQIPLPSVGTSGSDSWEYDHFFKKAVLLSAPKLLSSGNKDNDNEWEFTVMMIYEHYYKLVFAMAGDKTWTEIKPARFLIDLMSCDGQIYAIDGAFQVLVLDSSGDSFQPRLVFPGLFKYSSLGFAELYIANGGSSINPFFYLKRFTPFMVKSIDGKLLVVLREIEDFECNPSFKVLEWREEEQKWKQLTSLGDQAIFVGKNNTICLPAIEFPELRPNSIYYNMFRYCGYLCIKNIGVFCMGEKRKISLDWVGAVKETCEDWSMSEPGQLPIWCFL